MLRKFEGFMKGINLGGWLSQSSLEQSRLDNFITKQDIGTIKTFGVDHASD